MSSFLFSSPLFLFRFFFSPPSPLPQPQTDLRPGSWTQRAICPATGNARGRLAVSKPGDLYIVLPDFAASEIRILRATKAGGYTSYAEVWAGRGLTGEPLVDSARLEHDGVLSVLALSEEEGAGAAEGAQTGERRRKVAVLDFQL